MPTGTLQIRQISGHSGSVPGAGVQREEEVCKYVDVTTCIGCKACEVACVEWNDMPFQQTTFDNTYQTMPATQWNYWNLIKFHEHQRDDGTQMWLMRKDQCMHCEDPGCLRACPADGAIVQYTNGIGDFQQENCIGCQYSVSGCPFAIPTFTVWKRFAKPIALVLSLFGAPVAFFHYVSQGPKEPQPPPGLGGPGPSPGIGAKPAPGGADRVSE